MLEQCFTRPAILRGHRDGLLGPYVDSLAAKLVPRGYPRQTMRLQCCGIRDLGLWLGRKGLAVADLDDELVTTGDGPLCRSICPRSTSSACCRPATSALRRAGAITRCFFCSL